MSKTWWEQGGLFDTSGPKSTDELIAFLSSHKIEIYHECALRMQEMQRTLEQYRLTAMT